MTRYRIIDSSEIHDNDNLTTPEILRYIRKNNHKLDGVQINYAPFHNDAVDQYEEIGDAIKSNLTLTSLGISLWQETVHWPSAIRILEGISGNRHICKFNFTGDGVWSILTQTPQMMNTLFENENIKSFSMVGCEIASGDVLMLVNALTRRRKNLESLQLGTCNLDSYGVMYLMSLYNSHPNSARKCLSLSRNRIGDAGCFFISEVLMRNDVDLEELKLDSNNIGPVGLQLISCALIGTRRPLQKLSIGNNCIGDGLTMAFVTPFSSDHDMLPKSLHLDGNGITIIGLSALLQLLALREDPLDELHVGNNYFGNEELQMFPEIFRVNPGAIPKLINLDRMGVDHDGYIALSELLRLPNCSLEELVMHQNHPIRDETITHIATTLESNVNLKHVWLDTSQLSPIGWECISKAICDTSTMASSFESNHSLITFGNSYDQPDDVITNLGLNDNPYKDVVACLKVVENHLAWKFHIDKFNEMQPALLVEFFQFINKAYVMHENDNFWMEGEDSDQNNCLAVHYLILRNMPAMFDFKPTKTKNKNDEKEMKTHQLWCTPRCNQDCVMALG